MLDQRLLPGREEWLRCETPEEVATAIAEMAVRGAPAIGLAAAYGLALAVDEGERCAEERTVHLEEAAKTLSAARPTASNLAWALRRGLAAEDPLESARALEREQLAADRALSELGAERFQAGDRA